MPLATELGLPHFDHTDRALRGDHYRTAMAALHGQDALIAVARRVGRLTLDGEPVFGTPSSIYGLGSLPIRLTWA